MPGSCIGHFDGEFEECSEKCRRSKACRRLTAKCRQENPDRPFKGKRKEEYEEALRIRSAFKNDWAAISDIVNAYGGMNKTKRTRRK